MLKDMVTIVIPCKNEENYIGYLLYDLGRQENITGVKIIIADQSTDNTRAVISTQKKNLNVEVIDGGLVSTAKNNGARLVTTPYILFIDSDVRLFSETVIKDTVNEMESKNLDLMGLKIRCYDNNKKTQLSFTIFNIINKIMSHFIPFAVGGYFLTRTEVFWKNGGFAERYPTSEDFHLSRMYDRKKFKISNNYFGQDSRRFKKMGYFGMSWYLIKNFINRNNKNHWEKMDGNKYWL